MQGETGERALAEAFERYEAAVASGEHSRLVLARTALISQLEAAGWEPPAEVQNQMWRDRRALREIEHERVADVAGLLRVPSHRPPGSQRPSAAAS